MLGPLHVRLPIAAKAIFLIGALALMSAAANWFCLRGLGELDRINAILTQQVAPARQALAEAKIAVTAMGLATYKAAGTTYADTAREAASDLGGQYASAKNWLNEVRGYFPERGEDVR